MTQKSLKTTSATNVISRCKLTYEFTPKIDPTFHPVESEHNKAEVIERAGRIFKC